jgi:hypothetical protein
VTSPGWFAAIGCAVLLILVNLVIWMIVTQIANGAPRSYVAGIRLPSLLRSEEAWHVGHVAARAVMSPYLFVAVGVGVLTVPLQLFPAAYVVALGLSLTATLLALGIGAVHASRAARHVRDGASPSTDH